MCLRPGPVRWYCSGVSTKAQVRAVIYDRESKGNLASIASQNSVNLEIVEEHGYLLIDSFTDKVGASRQSTKVRKGHPDLMALLEAGGADVVVTTEPSRLDRNLARWVPFVDFCRDRGVRIHLSGEDDLKDPRKGSHYRSLIDAGLAAHMETETLSKRVTRGTKTAAVAGGFHGDAPYGYERVMVGHRMVVSGDRIVKKPLYEQRAHAEWGPVAGEILSALAAKVPISAIARDLEARGIPAPNGGDRWDRKTIRNMAFIVSYIGKRRHKDKIYDAAWEGLVKEETFLAAQAFVGEAKRKGTK